MNVAAHIFSVLPGSHCAQCVPTAITMTNYSITAITISETKYESAVKPCLHSSYSGFAEVSLSVNNTTPLALQE